MRYLCLILTVAILSAFISGCHGAPAQSRGAFHHNNREHYKWVKNPSHKPDYRNPNTGGKLFY